MNITFVLAVFNKLDLTQNCYKRVRQIYPDAPLVISSGGSSVMKTYHTYMMMIN